ncbi:hypothetical protein [Chelativorans sp. M5D2P16]|uniref:hypothetical protein n=1 Tax=Chelativorans sp. M5D2P16 TaxID=3095678 RepID=UPI002ACAC5E9|nr:hypothetical protein [Chelativorans sp. M5D2P16]MDZ5699952.1 hypothetical protein [Chelativorans sp. M5D2P16]
MLLVQPIRNHKCRRHHLELQFFEPVGVAIGSERTLQVDHQRRALPAIDDDQVRGVAFAGARIRIEGQALKGLPIVCFQCFQCCGDNRQSQLLGQNQDARLGLRDGDEPLFEQFAFMEGDRADPRCQSDKAAEDLVMAGSLSAIVVSVLSTSASKSAESAAGAMRAGRSKATTGAARGFRRRECPLSASLA